MIFLITTVPEHTAREIVYMVQRSQGNITHPIYWVGLPA